MKNSFNFKNPLFLLGVSCILFAIFFNQFSWLAFFDNDGTPSVNVRTWFFFLDVSFVTVGLLLILNRNNFKKFIFTFISIWLMAASVEIALRIFHSVINDKTETVDKRYYLSPYKDKEWAYEFWKDHTISWNTEYKPFLGWDRREYHSKHTNVDCLGVRTNWNPKISQDKSYKKIYMFGGSTTWGTGARDEFTIPSYLSKMLYQNDYDFQVSNYGETAYGFLKEIFHLILLLRDGHRPDFVIFYDGVNDVYGAYQSGVAGTPQNVELMKKKLKASYPSEKEQLKNSLIYLIELRWSMIQRVTKKFFSSIYSEEKRFEEKASKYTEEELCQLAIGITKHYQSSIDLLDKLSNAYGFEYLCFWQPVIFTEKNVTKEESSVDIRLEDKSIGKLYEDVNAIYQDKNIPTFYNLSNVLNGRNMTFYIDFAHLSEEGNEVVAKEIFSRFKKEYLVNE